MLKPQIVYTALIISLLMLVACNKEPVSTEPDPEIIFAMVEEELDMIDNSSSYEKIISQINNSLNKYITSSEVFRAESVKCDAKLSLMYEQGVLQNVISTDNEQYIIYSNKRKSDCKSLGNCMWLECTGSMRPTFTCMNTLTYVKSRKASVGNIIIFPNRHDDDNVRYTIHRIIDEQGNYWITKGDANEMIDEGKVLKDNVIGIIVQVDYRK